MKLRISPISENELGEFYSILEEAALWLKDTGKEMWTPEQISIEKLLRKHTVEEMYMGYLYHEAVATMILQEKDDLFWADKNDEAIYLHKLAIRRKYAKNGLAEEMIKQAISLARNRNKRYIRLDCAADRPKLCEFYEKQGFQKVREQVMFGRYPTAFYELVIFDRND